MWRTLPADERAYWDDVAAKDKERYMVEKASYTGPWQVPWKRAKKDPTAPKRPMSAFLYYSQGKRTLLKKKHPDMKNTEVSRLLGEMWRNASEAEKRPHVEKEKDERSKYKIAIAEWRKETEVKQRAARKAQAEWASSNAAAQRQAAQDAVEVPPPPYVADPYAQGPQYIYQHPHMPYGYHPTGGYSYPHQGQGASRQPVILGPNGAPHYAQTDFAPPDTSGSPAATFEVAADEAVSGAMDHALPHTAHHHTGHLDYHDPVESLE